jgi:hypothetical protein
MVDAAFHGEMTPTTPSGWLTTLAYPGRNCRGTLRLSGLIHEATCRLMCLIDATVPSEPPEYTTCDERPAWYR